MHIATQLPFRHAPETARLPKAARPAHQARQVPTAARWPQADAEAARESAFALGQTLFFEGDRAVHYFEIVSGTVRCCRLTPDGRRQIYRFAGPGDILGLGDAAEHSYAAEAVTAVVIRRHRLAALDGAMAVDAPLRDRVLAALRQELAAVRLQMLLLGQMSAMEKVATFLRILAAGAAESGAPVHLPMRRADIADYLGLTIETVSRKLNELKRLGVIELPTPCEFRIVQSTRLEALAEAA